MTQEEKDLALRDLCARLPYGVIYQVARPAFPSMELRFSNEKLRRLEVTIDGDYGVGCNSATLTSISKVKPYLRPLSSMTEDEKNELKEYLDAAEVDYNGFGYSEGGTLEDYISSIPYSICSSVVDWLNKKMFDYRGLIPKDIALSTEEFNPYKIEEL